MPRFWWGPRNVKVALAWTSKVTSILGLFYLSDLTVDLDLKVFDASGNQVGYSGSWDNSYEIAEFVGQSGPDVHHSNSAMVGNRFDLVRHRLDRHRRAANPFPVELAEADVEPRVRSAARGRAAVRDTYEELGLLRQPHTRTDAVPRDARRADPTAPPSSARSPERLTTTNA